MCETFKRMKLPAGELPKDGSTDSCKNIFGKIIVSDARAFQSTLKMQIFAIRRQISIYGLDVC